MSVELGMSKWFTGASAVLHNGRCDSLKGCNGDKICEVCLLGKASTPVVDGLKSSARAKVKCKFTRQSISGFVRLAAKSLQIQLPVLWR